ncbi:MAG: 23S rRNA (uracil(1939)-C(5))-methyltransferase RlmD [Lachnospiraceae bacterium]|nr:23S rRNA (uracil(1939)-C(5))-methyltransferase RlmD [Lachnospiraceae bacterium]
MEALEKNQELIVKIEDTGSSGEGIAKVDGYPLFIKDAIRGDVARVKVTKALASYGYARLMDILEASPDRVPPRCPNARRCGGCQIQEMSYEAQLKYKEKKVLDALVRIGKISPEKIIFEPIIGMESPWCYRNKAQFPVGRDPADGTVATGFYAERTHALMPVNTCLLNHEKLDQAAAAVRDYMEQSGATPYDEITGKGLVRHVLTRYGFHSGQLMVCLVINGTNIPKPELLISRLKQVDGLTSVSLNINKEKTNVILGKTTRHIYGPGYITDEIGGVKFRISPQSFYQVNPVQTEKLYGKALEYAGLTGKECVWDLYCGIGTISLFMAKQARKVYGIEIVPQAIEDAKKNAVLNGITNVEFFVGKAEEEFARIAEKPDVVVVDPPRKGCDEKLLAAIVSVQPERVVYVSCDPATLARDVRYLEEHGYELKKAQPVDQFCHSFHVETIVQLSKGEINSKKVRVEFSLEDMDMSGFQKGATYGQIKEYVKEHTGLSVSSLYIAQIKQKYGIIERECYNKPKSENAKQPQCPPEKEAAITEALKYFKMI